MAEHADTLQVSIGNTLDPVKLSAIARETGFLQRKSKLKPEEFIDTLMFSWFDHSQLSLQDCCNDLAQQHQKSLSKVGLHKRFNANALKFMKAVLAEQIASKMNLSLLGDKWKPFSRIVIADSSKFALPEAYKKDYPGYGGARSKSLLNIQYAFDLKDGNWENLEFTKGTQNDKTHSNNSLQRILKGDLHIRDLGYMTHDYVKKVVKEEAFFLNRLHPLWKPVKCNTGKAINWTALYRKMCYTKETHFETMITIGTGNDAFNCRLIAVPVPEEIWAERIRKAQEKAKSVGSTLSDDYKVRARFSVFITNTEQNILKAADVIQLYRLRWQIELIFKNWKSLLSIQKVKAVKKERFECQLLAKLIWILLNWKIFQCIDNFIQKNSSHYACSFWKFFKQARQCGHALRKAFAGKIKFRDWCEIFICPIVKHLVIEDKKGKKSSYVIVNDIFNPLG